MLLNKGVIRGNNTPVYGEVSKFIQFYQLPKELKTLKKNDKIKVYYHNEREVIIYPVLIREIVNDKEITSEGYYEFEIKNFEELKMKLTLIKR